MACKEIAALRLGLMNLAHGIQSKLEERKHDLAELGDDAHKNGPLKSLSESNNYEDLVALYGQCLSDLQGRLIDAMDNTEKTAEERRESAYYQSLMILNRKIEMELLQQQQNFSQLLQDLDKIHHFIHEIHPPVAF